MSGFVLPIHKEVDWTSHDAVHMLRTVLGIQEIGHAGSLDPFATGILLCGIGRGTKVISYLMDLRKTYEGTMHLGKITETGDVTGTVIEERPVDPITLDEARDLAARFIGRQEQIPPMVSAIKHQGKRLYELARAGIEVERRPRTVEVDSFEVISVLGHVVEFRIVCSKGTYVRGLARDFGEALGPGACVETLHRSAIGGFSDDRAVRLTGDRNEIADSCKAAAVGLASALGHVPALHLVADWVRRVRRGEQPPWRAVTESEILSCDHYRLLGPAGDLVALVSLEPVPGPIDRPWRDCWELKLDRVL